MELLPADLWDLLSVQAVLWEFLAKEETLSGVDNLEAAQRSANLVRAFKEGTVKTQVDKDLKGKQVMGSLNGDQGPKEVTGKHSGTSLNGRQDLKVTLVNSLANHSGGQALKVAVEAHSFILSLVLASSGLNNLLSGASLSSSSGILKLEPEPKVDIKEHLKTGGNQELLTVLSIPKGQRRPVANLFRNNKRT